MELKILWTIVFFFTYFTVSVSGARIDARSPIVYSRDQLLALDTSADIPHEVRRMRRCTRAGIGPCHTKENETLGLLYANTTEAYSSSLLPRLGGLKIPIWFISSLCVLYTENQV